MLWIKEVEMVESVDDLKSSRSIQGYTRFPNFEKTRSSRIPTSRKRSSLEEQKAQKEDRFLRRRQIACMIYDYFRVTGAGKVTQTEPRVWLIFWNTDNMHRNASLWRPSEAARCGRRWRRKSSLNHGLTWTHGAPRAAAHSP